MKDKHTPKYYKRKYRGFPISDNVRNCFLSGMYYCYKDVNRSDGWEAVQLDIKYGSKKLYHRVYFPLEREGESVHKFNKRFSEAKCMMERVMAAFLNRDTRAKINRDTYEGGVFDYFREFQKIYLKNELFTVPLVIKVIRNSSGFISLPRYGEFIRQDDENGENFSYTEYEKKILEKYDFLQS